MVLRWEPHADNSSGHLLSLPPLSWGHSVTHNQHPAHACGVPGTVLGTEHGRMGQSPAHPELLRPWCVCSRFWEGSGGGSQAGPSDQFQGMGQGAGLDPAHPEHVVPFCVGPDPDPPPEKNLGEPRPAGLPTLALPPLLGSASPSSAPRMATRRTPHAVASMASWRPTITACALCSFMVPPTSPRWSPMWPGECRGH